MQQDPVQVDWNKAACVFEARELPFRDTLLFSLRSRVTLSHYAVINPSAIQNAH